MFEINGTFQALKVETLKYNKSLDKAMQTQIRQAARAWLRAVILKVPVWTGTSRGTLKPLGAFLKVAVPINPVVTRPDMGPSVGAGQSEFSFLRKDNTWIFEFDLELVHYVINEYYDVSNYIHLRTPGPYDSLQAGQAAFQAYIEDNLLERTPNLDTFITSNARVVY